MSHGAFESTGKEVVFKNSSRRDIEFFAAFGPMKVMSTMMKLTGLPAAAKLNLLLR